jgi:hypothetical protein
MVLNVFAEQLLPLLRNPKIPQDWGQFEDLKMWILVVGAIEGKEAVRAGLLDFLVDAVRRLRIESHSHLEDSVGQLIWVNAADDMNFWDLELELWGFED